LVRERAGLKGVVESWAAHSRNPDKPATREGMREIIQRERLIEMAFEGKRFWDIRRWKQGIAYFNKPIRGWNVLETAAEDYYSVRTLFTMSFSERDYLWPIPENEIVNNPSLVQNPGWGPRNRNIMKTFHLPLYILLLLLASCKEKLGHDPVLRDNTRPGPVQNVRFEPINGGFDIYYDLPADKDILYVKAEYVDSKGRTATAKSSAYGNWIRIEGFGDGSEKTVTLYAVDRSENLSDPVSFKGPPLVPPLDSIKATMEFTEYVSGARFTWVNELQTPIAILLYAENENGVLESVRTVYTSQRTTSFSLRGYASEPTRFAAVIRDRYDNFTDTIYPATPDRLLTPLFEEQLDKGKFRKVVLSDDTNWDAWEGYYEGWYDESLHDVDGIAHTQGDDPFPQIWTVDLGVNVKDRKSTRLNSSHVKISYAVFCLK